MLIIISMIFLIVVVFLYLYSKYMFLDEFMAMDEKSAKDNIKRVLNILDYEISSFSAVVADWSSWDDTYKFIQDANEDYINSNLVDSTFTNLNISLMMFVDNNGKVVYGKAVNLENGSEMPIPDSFKQYLALNNHLINLHNKEGYVSGIILLPENPMIVISRPILSSNDESPIRGTLIMGRYFDSIILDKFSKIANLSLKMSRIDDTEMSSDLKLALSSLSTNKTIVAKTLSSKFIAGYALINDINRKPALLLRADTPRNFYQQGKNLISSYLFSLGLVGLLLAGFSLLISDRVFFSRIARLSNEVTSIGAREDISARVFIVGKDEISKMAGAVNDMLAALEHSQEKLQEEEGRYHTIFEESPISLWEQDFSEVKKYIEELRNAGVEDFRLFFKEHPEEVSKCIKLVNVIDVNKASLELFNVGSKELFIKDFDRFFPQDAIDTFREELIFIAEDKTSFEGELIALTLNGEKVNIYLKWAVVPGNETSYSRLLFSVIDITENKRAEEKLKHLSTHDSLTNLYNRTFFEEQMKLLSMERDISVGILMIDLDGLKYVNDVFGHRHGDKLLINLSSILLKTFRPSDVIARIGGDEFAVLVRNVDYAALKGISERVKSNIELHNQRLGKRQNPISISIGIALKDSNLKTIEKTFKEADEDLFRDKIPKREDVRKSILNVIKATMYEKDHPTEEHMRRLKDLADRFGEAMDLSNEDSIKLVLTTELHDIGKIMVPDYILNKEGPLSMGEFQVIEKHTEAGYRIAKATPEIAHIADFILYSHERWDGNGYPGRLKGEAIPLISRMAFILDAYDAMTNDRPYRKALSREEAVNELRENANTQFDPNLIKIFINDVLKKSNF